MYQLGLLRHLQRSLHTGISYAHEYSKTAQAGQASCDAGNAQSNTAADFRSPPPQPELCPACPHAQTTERREGLPGPLQRSVRHKGGLLPLLYPHPARAKPQRPDYSRQRISVPESSLSNPLRIQMSTLLSTAYSTASFWITFGNGSQVNNSPALTSSIFSASS